MPIEPTSGTALVRGQCLTNTSANVWQQIWAQSYMHWGAGRERYHGAVSWSPVPNPQLSEKAYSRTSHPWPQARVNKQRR